MQRYVLTIALGQVQEFIAAARRTRDLWFGSWLLSEVSKATACALRECESEKVGLATKVTLIFPHATDEELKANSSLTVANKVVALLSTDSPAACATHVRARALDRWRGLARAVVSPGNGKLAGYIRDEVWDWQAETDDAVIEFYAAWAACESDERSQQAVARAEKLLAARKATRDFMQSPAAADSRLGLGVPKSSLDAARETVLKDKGEIADKEQSEYLRLLKRYGIGDGEQLDCPGLLKRVQGRQRPFASLARVAAAPWVEYLEAQHGKVLDALEAAHEQLIGTDPPIVTRGVGKKQRLDFDGQLVYEARHRVAMREASELNEPQVAIALEEIKRRLEPFWRRARGHLPPQEYVALLLADGDSMGEFIHDVLAGHEQHQKASKLLANFAGQIVPNTVREHRGQCVYAGGDDLLAFLPVAHAIDCAGALAKRFGELFNSIIPADGSQAPTLSAGIAFGHILTPLGELRTLADDALKLAKDGFPGEQRRNALGLVIGSRNGSAIRLRGRWDEASLESGGELGFKERLLAWRDEFAAERLADRSGYQLRTLAVEFADLPEALEAEAQNLVERSTGAQETESAARQRTIKLVQAYLADRNRSAARLADEWIAARWLAAHGSDPCALAGASQEATG